MVLLRPLALSVLISVVLPSAGTVARAEPLDKQACADLQVERKRLLTRDMQAALDQGPDWVKHHLNDDAIGKVRHFLTVEEEIQFRCRGGGVAKVTAKPAETGPGDAVPLPERKPTLPTAESDDTKPSQAVADSDKTPPGKSKATR